MSKLTYLQTWSEPVFHRTCFEPWLRIFGTQPPSESNSSNLTYEAINNDSFENEWFPATEHFSQPATIKWLNGNVMLDILVMDNIPVLRFQVNCSLWAFNISNRIQRIFINKIGRIVSMTYSLGMLGIWITICSAANISYSANITEQYINKPITMFMCWQLNPHAIERNRVPIGNTSMVRYLSSSQVSRSSPENIGREVLPRDGTLSGPRSPEVCTLRSQTWRKFFSQAG